MASFKSADDILASLGITDEDCEDIDRNIRRLRNFSLHIWGFDCDTTREQFHHYVKAHPAAADETPITVYGGFELYEKCHQEADLKLFIYIFFKYGNITNALKDAGAAATIISKKYDQYKIKSGQSNAHKLRSELTLSRIARAFPVHAAKLILKEKFPGILRKSAFFGQELPLLLQHSILPGLVPAKQFNKELKWIACVLNMEISVKLSSAEARRSMMIKTVEQLMWSSDKYVYETILFKLDTDEEKLEILTQAGILEVKGDELQLSAEVTALVSKSPSINALYDLTYSEALNVVNDLYL